MDHKLVGASVAALRDHNLGLVLRQILASPGMSRTEIAARIGLTDAAVSRITRELIESGFVREGEEVPAEPGQRGRRHVRLAPDGRGAFFLAVSLTISDRRVSIVDLTGRRRAEASLPAQLPREYPVVVESVVGAARHLLGKTRTPRTRVLGLAVATAGAVDQSSGRVVASSLATLEGQDLAADLSRALGLPATVETIGNTFGLAEAHRAAQDGGSGMSGPSLVIHVAFGIGVSFMLDGQPVRHGGDERTAGHVLVAGGAHRCVCGAKGCLMTEAAGYGVLRRLASIPSSAPGQRWEEMRPDALRDAVARAQEGDAAVVEVMSGAGNLLGTHLLALGSVVAPRRVLLGGPLAAAPAFVAGVRKGMAEAYARIGAPTPVLCVSAIDYLRATELLAIEEFALRRPLGLGSSAAA